MSGALLWYVSLRRHASHMAYARVCALRLLVHLCACYRALPWSLDHRGCSRFGFCILLESQKVGCGSG